MREETHRALKRLLVSGPLTGLPTRPADLTLLLQLAALRFDPEKTYSEREVNEILATWLETFCAPFGVDYVTMRRLLVDALILQRDKAGNSYRLRDLGRPGSGAQEAIEPSAVLEEIRIEREERKKKHLGRQE